MAYRTVIANLSGAELDEVPARNLDYSFILNGSGSVNFDLPLHEPKCDPDVLDPGSREIHIYRDDALVWGGYLWGARVQRDVVTFTGNTYISRLGRRTITDTLPYSQVDQFDIAWNLINYTQSKESLGISRFSTALSGIKRDRTYLAGDRKPILDALTQLGAVEMGFDFEITPDKRWKTYYPQKGTTVTTVTYSLDKNVQDWSLTIDATKLANSITAIGAPDPVIGAPLLSTAVDAASRTEYGLLEDTTSYTDIIIQATLDGHAAEDLRLMKAQNFSPEPVVFTITDPPFGAFVEGDTIGLDFESGYVNLQAFMRCVSREVKVNPSGQELMSVFFNVNEPEPKMHHRKL